jgi:predicted nucleic acid-binding protein
MKAVFDSNILIDYLKGIPGAAQEINQFENKNISIISYIEVLVGLKENDTVLAQVKGFLHSFNIIMVSAAIADLTISARQNYRLKIPDAIILATAQSLEALLVTRNSKDFSPDNPMVRVPY